MNVMLEAGEGFLKIEKVRGFTNYILLSFIFHNFPSCFLYKFITRIINKVWIKWKLIHQASVTHKFHLKIVPGSGLV